MPGQTAFLTSPSRQHLFVILVSIASFMGTLDSTIVNISLPTIAGYYNTSISFVSWIPIAYMLTLASTLIAFGHFADLHGYRKVYLAGFVIFTVASFFCAVSPKIEILIGFRVLQGLGAAMLQAIGGAMIAVYLPKEIRGWALGMLSTFAALGVAVGPVLGGYLTEYLSWHWIFFVNIPVGICAVVLGRMVMPADQPREQAHGSFDLYGAVLLFITLGSLIFSVSLGRTFGYGSAIILSSLIIFMLGTAAFLYRELHVPDPLVRLSLFKNRDFTLGNIGLLCTFVLYLGTSFLMPFYLEQGRGFATDIAGLFMLIPALALIATSSVAGRLSDRIGSRVLCSASGICFIGAMLLFSTLGTSTPVPMLIATLVLFGCSLGLFIAPNFKLLMGHAPRGEEGVVSSLAMTVRNTGSSLGVAVFSTLFVTGAGIVSAGMAITDAQRDLGLHTAFTVGCAVALIILISAFYSHERQEPK
jgi:EmrB/QacA subfamily drug resistance transporter